MSKPLTIQYTGKYANHLLREKYKEIERLNNIINGMEKYLERRITDYKTIKENVDIHTELYCLYKLDDFEEVLDKLQELKGEDKE